MESLKQLPSLFIVLLPVGPLLFLDFIRFGGGSRRRTGVVLAQLALHFENCLSVTNRKLKPRSDAHSPTARYNTIQYNTTQHESTTISPI